MLTRLHIRNLAILPEITVEFREGLNVLTGETGAGKSILIDAISLLAGARSSSDDVRAGAVLAEVEGTIRLSSTSEEFVIRRTVGSDGRSRAWIRGETVNVARLIELSPRWVEISGQHGQQALIREESHLELVDQFCGSNDLREEFSQGYASLRAIDSQLQLLQSRREEAGRQKDFLEFQLKELMQAKLVTGEEEELQASSQRLSHGVKLVEAASRMESIFSGEEGIVSLLGKVSSEVRTASRLDESLLSWLADLEELQAKASDLSQRVELYGRSLNLDPEEVDRINERLSLLQRLGRKYGSIEAAITERDRTQSLLELMSDPEGSEAELKERREKEGADLLKVAKKLSKIRNERSKEFSEGVSAELQRLGMPQARLEVRFETAEEREGYLRIGSVCLGPEGLESAHLSMAPNPGEGFRPLSKIASGGELSRVWLAIKSLALGKIRTDRTYLFDEVDAGIGGETADRVGKRLQNLAQGRQVLCVTHLAQIAAYADLHLSVEKRIRQGRTEATLSEVSGPSRVEELARMLGGKHKTDAAVKYARELLHAVSA